MATLLEAPLVDETLQALPGWHGDQTGIWREVHLPHRLDEVLRHQVDVDAAAMGHEPQMQHIEGGTRFALRTPEVGGVSELDVALASHISDLAHRLRSSEPGVDAVRNDDVELVAGSEDTPLELTVQPEKVRAQVRF
jgi:4a-hydroxytetrahydrobiopterin dehydratase